MGDNDRVVIDAICVRLQARASIFMRLLRGWGCVDSKEVIAEPELFNGRGTQTRSGGLNRSNWQLAIESKIIDSIDKDDKLGELQQ